MSCVCSVCAQDGSENFDLLLTVLDEAQSLMCGNSDALARIEQAKYSLEAVVRPFMREPKYRDVISKSNATRKRVTVWIT